MASRGPLTTFPLKTRPNRVLAASRTAVVLVMVAMSGVAGLPGCGGIGLDSSPAAFGDSSERSPTAPPSLDAGTGAPSPGAFGDAATDTVASPNRGTSPLCNWMGVGTGCLPDEPVVNCMVNADAGASHPGTDAGGNGADGGAADAGQAPEAAPPPLGCHVVKKSSTSVGPTCGESGIGTEMSPCLNGASCASGFECIGVSGQCRQYCCASSCGDARFCDIQPMFGSRDALKVPVCMPIVTCKLLSPCDKAKETCAVVNESTGQTTCVAVGLKNVGDECETEHCAENLTCLGSAGSRKCHKLCRVDAKDACGPGEQCSSNSMTFKDGVGVCAKLTP